MTRQLAFAFVNSSTTEPESRTVVLYSWWQNRDGSRRFAVVEKLLTGVGKNCRTTSIKLLEDGDPTPFIYSIQDFFDLVDTYRLLPYHPHTTI